MAVKVRSKEEDLIGGEGIKISNGGKKEQMVEGGFKKVHTVVEGKKFELPKRNSILMYRSVPEDKSWENVELVATVVSGESILSIQHQVEDAGF